MQGGWKVIVSPLTRPLTAASVDLKTLCVMTAAERAYLKKVIVTKNGFPTAHEIDLMYVNTTEFFWIKPIDYSLKGCSYFVKDHTWENDNKQEIKCKATDNVWKKEEKRKR